MSRLETIKKQYPHLNITLIDLLCELDGTKSHKYLQLLCKIFSPNHTPFDEKERRFSEFMREMNFNLENYGLSKNEDEKINYIKLRFFEGFYRKDEIETFRKFKDYLERGLIDENDVSQYSNINQLSQAISLSEIKISDKGLESKVYKEFEDDKWLLVRPLTFQSSIKYGAGTKWCTTYENEKHYFFKYFFNGVLVYIINKITGYKVAFHGVEGKNRLEEITFWSADDKRVDYVDTELDDYLLSKIKDLIKENKVNSSFLEPFELFEVASYCNSIDRLLNKDYDLYPVEAEVPGPVAEIVPTPYTTPYPDLGPQPTMRA